MFNLRQSIIATRPAAMALALVLFAAITGPFVILQSMHAFATTPSPPCTEGNYNGCTELSATPPEDVQSVPPNIVLMLDDSGSMAWDYMPDWTSLGTGLPAGWNSSNYGVRNAAINSLYYNPAVAYTPPPKADSTATVPDFFPDSPGITHAYKDGFHPPGASNVTTYTASYAPPAGGTPFAYYTALPSTNVTNYPAPVLVCPSGYTASGGTCLPPSAPPPVPKAYKCNSGDTLSGTTCTHVDHSGETPVTTTYPATFACPSGYPTFSGGLCHAPTPVPVAPTWKCQSGGTAGGGTPPTTCTTRQNIYAFTYVTGAPGSYTVRYVASGTQCSLVYNAAQAAACVNEGDTSGVSAPIDPRTGTNFTAGQNVANWFSYYRTRMLMAKSGLMEAFINVDPKYRFGFGSINAMGTIPAGTGSSSTPYAFDDSMADGTGGSATNKLAVVQPFGDGTIGTQKAAFWTWLINISQGGATPLRKALNAVGQYYQTAGPWATLPGDPGWTTGSTTKFTCRASYAILTTDGFWNGDAPSASGSAALANAANIAGPVNTVPAGNVPQYLAVAPFSGGAVGGGTDASLADVATYYWETDLNTDFANEVSASTSDPASWQHMTTFTVGMGFPPTGIAPIGTTVPQIFGWADGGAAITGFSWPTPASNSLYNIADLAHAAVNGHGDFFNVTNPAELATAFQQALADIGARSVAPSAAAVNSSVLGVGAAAFQTGYTTGDWSGQLDAVSLLNDGSIGQSLWKAEDLLNAAFHSPSLYVNRKVFTSAYTSSTFSAFQFTAANAASLDTVETAGLEAPALAGGNDTLANRINYLLGDNTYEGALSLYRQRTNILGAIIHSEPVYVAGAIGNYRNGWPTIGSVTPPEASSGAQAYSTFVNLQISRAPRVYVGANDGMLHAFDAPVAQCAGTISADGSCSVPFTFTDINAGQEQWAFVPRAVYANLGNLTKNVNFQFRPTVDVTPVSADVFFSEGGTNNNKWQTILAGGVGLGGRGVYALNITDPTSFTASNVLWEFDSDMTVNPGCVSIQGVATDSIGCRGTDLGFTVQQPNIGRLANGKWVVLVPNGYFPDCSTPDAPTADTASCQAIAAQVPKDSSGNPYSALFVLDAQTGTMIAELKTPAITGVTSFGLAKPVLGDYNSDQVSDVAFAGDVQGNLWRFDMSDTNPANWTVSLVYQGLSAGGHQGVQPITTMPRLFPDADTGRFLVLFGTGKYMGVGDNTNNTQQTIYSVRDTVGTSYTQADLVQQYLHETIAAAGTPFAGSTLRCVTGAATDDCTTSATPLNTVSSSAGGWYVNLYTSSGGTQNDLGERVVVNPAAIFATNTVIFESLITGAESSDACNPSTEGAILALDAASGGPGAMSSLGGWPMAGARIQSARTSGSLPVVSAMTGGSGLFPTAQSQPSGKTLSTDIPISRRRAWRVLLNDQ